MVSPTRWAASSVSSASSYSESWESQQGSLDGTVYKERGRKSVEPISPRNEREIAARVLEDLETLCIDSEDDGDDSGDDFDSESEWGFDTSSCDRRGKRRAGGMTLEELSIAVNAAIEYHRPTNTGVVEPQVTKVRHEAGKKSESRSCERRQRHRSYHQQKSATKEPSRREESVLDMFQAVLEDKERQFYSLKAANDIVDTGNKHDQLEYCAETRNITVDQQQQTTTCVKDQATETENYPPRSPLDPLFPATEFVSEPRPPPQNTYGKAVSTSKVQIHPVAVGPTLADLANGRRRSERSHSPCSSRSFSPSDSLWSSSSSSSSSSASDRLFQSSHSSFSSRRSVVSSGSNCTSGRSSSRSSKRSNSSMLSISGRSTHSRYEDQSQVNRTATDSLIQEAMPNDQQLDLTEEVKLDKVVPTGESKDSPQIIRNPTLVKWELDLSNFSF